MNHQYLGLVTMCAFLCTYKCTAYGLCHQVEWLSFKWFAHVCTLHYSNLGTIFYCLVSIVETFCTVLLQMEGKNEGDLETRQVLGYVHFIRHLCSLLSNDFRVHSSYLLPACADVESLEIPNYHGFPLQWCNRALHVKCTVFNISSFWTSIHFYLAK